MLEAITVALSAFVVITVIVAAIVVGRERGKSAVKVEEERARADRAVTHLQEVSAKAQAAEIWEGETRAVRTRADRLQDENKELTAALREANGRTDITQVMTLIGDSMKTAAEMQERTLNRVADHFENHEQRATERHQATVEAFSHLNESLAAVTRTLTSQAQATERRNGSG